MAEWRFQFSIVVWAYCFVMIHVHMVAIPETEDGLRKGIGEAHRRYTIVCGEPN